MKTVNTCSCNWRWQFEEIGNFLFHNGKESTVNRAQGGSTYPG